MSLHAKTKVKGCGLKRLYHFGTSASSTVRGPSLDGNLVDIISRSTNAKDVSLRRGNHSIQLMLLHEFEAGSIELDLA